MNDPLKLYPGYALRRAASAMMSELTALLAPLDLRVPDASILVVIGANPGIRPSAIGRMLDIQRPNMVPRVAGLEKKGLIERRPIDGKSQGLTLTPAGEHACREVQAITKGFEKALIARIPADHRPHFLPALNALWTPGR